MDENAFVTWAETSEPWRWEERALATLDRQLNLSGNARHPFHPLLTAACAAAKAMGESRRHLPVDRAIRSSRSCPICRLLSLENV
jgi:hypothetical protein